MRRQHRHRPYYAEQSRKRSAAIKPILSFVIFGALVLFGGKWLVGQLGFGGAVQRAAVILSPEEKGTVKVSLDGGDWKRADQEIKLYAGDKIETSAGTNASIAFFDGTFARLDENTSLHISESKKRTEGESEISIHIPEGSLWIASPSVSVFPGLISRTISTPYISTNLLAKTEAVIHQKALMIFDGDGEGSTVSIAGRNESIIIGEGQRLFLPDGEADAQNIYSYRSALDPRGILSPFIEKSRTQFTAESPEPRDPSNPTTEVSNNNGLTLSVVSPLDEEEVFGNTVLVEGTYNQELVEDIQVNGYGAELAKGEFSIELSITDEEEIQISTEAIAANGDVLDKVIRTVYKNLTPPEAPSFVLPAKNGEVFETNVGKLQIIGTVGDDAVGIIVNDYRLQLFTPGSGEWKYLANVDYDNYQYGRNVFTAVAINKAGLKSKPVSMTIILREEGEKASETVIESESTTGGSTEQTEEPKVQNNESLLPKNQPLSPGTLTVSAPSAGTTHNAVGMDESDLLIEGLAPEGTNSIWVNGYRLRLFEPAKGFWNYIANVELGTLKRGSNTYVVTARNAAGEIIDTLTYVITFDPSEQ